MNFDFFFITKVSARHLFNVPLPKGSEHLPKSEIPTLLKPVLLPLPKVELPPLPHLPPLKNHKLLELSAPEIPKLSKLPNVLRPELLKLHELSILPKQVLPALLQPLQRDSKTRNTYFAKA